MIEFFAQTVALYNNKMDNFQFFICLVSPCDRVVGCVCLISLHFCSMYSTDRWHLYHWSWSRLL